MIYTFGAYGTGNLGDDAIFEGLLKKVFPDKVTQIYLNVPSYWKAIHYDDVCNGKFPEPVEPNSTLIIGGGGLFYSKRNLIIMNKIVDTALKYKMNIQIKGLGCEGVSQDEKELICQLCEKVGAIEVRSEVSKQILKSHGLGKKIFIASGKDLAYNIRPDIEAAKKIFPAFNEDLPIVGIATGGNHDNVDKLCRLVSEITIGETRVNIVHIPHCHHYAGQYNNDLITGEKLWSGIDIYFDNRLDKFQLLTFPKKPRTLAGVYQLVDMVIGMRYHSFIFTEMAKKPLFGLAGGNKATTYFKEHPNNSCVDIDAPIEEIIVKVKEFIAKNR